MAGGGGQRYFYAMCIVEGELGKRWMGVKIFIRAGRVGWGDTLEWRYRNIVGYR